MKHPETPFKRITDIRDQVRDPERVSVFVDGEFRVGLPRAVAAEQGLHVGQELTDEDVQRLEELGQISLAVEAAIRLLSFRPRSRSELEGRLRRKGFDDAVVEAAIERIARLGYVDDEEFARYWIDNRVRNRPRGKRMLAAELRAKGVPKAVIDETLDDTEIDEYGEALQLARKRITQLQGLEPAARERRLTGYLQRRGFGWETVRAVLETLRDEPED
jgi:regulatory protein